MLELYVYAINLGGQALAALSVLTPAEVERYGLPAEAVLGEVDPHRPNMTPADFTPNAAFLELLSDVIRQHAPQLDSLQKQAARVRNGAVYVIDWRSVQRGEQPPYEDMIGWFGVRQGQIIAASYNPNPNYQLLSAQGPLSLEAPLEAALLQAIRSRLHVAAPARVA